VLGWASLAFLCSLPASLADASPPSSFCCVHHFNPCSPLRLALAQPAVMRWAADDWHDMSAGLLASCLVLCPVCVRHLVPAGLAADLSRAALSEAFIKAPAGVSPTLCAGKGQHDALQQRVHFIATPAAGVTHSMPRADAAPQVSAGRPSNRAPEPLPPRPGACCWWRRTGPAGGGSALAGEQARSSADDGGLPQPVLARLGYWQLSQPGVCESPS
jgi:hypothetical protein